VNTLEEIKKNNRGKLQGGVYESMDLSESVLHSNAQGNFLFLLATLLHIQLIK
jgi:hypothetical protein